MGSGLVGTTAPSAADVGRDVVAATVTTVAAARGQERRTRVHFRERSPGPGSSGAGRPAGPSGGREHERGRARPATPTAAAGPPPGRHAPRTSRQRRRKDRPNPVRSHYGTPRGPAEPAGCGAAGPRDGKKPAEGGRSSRSARSPPSAEPGRRLVESETQSRRDEGENAEPEPRQLCPRNQAGHTKR